MVRSWGRYGGTGVARTVERIDRRTEDEYVPVRDLLATIDWSATPLGARDTWDRELEDTIRFILESRQPLVA